MAMYPNGRGNLLKTDKVWIRLPPWLPMKTKVCRTCHFDLPLTSFKVNKKNKCGRLTNCKSCFEPIGFMKTWTKVAEGVYKGKPYELYTCNYGKTYEMI
jgi:hypothetical protein